MTTYALLNKADEHRRCAAAATTHAERIAHERAAAMANLMAVCPRPDQRTAA